MLYEKEMEFCPAYIASHNSNRRKQIILLMISNGAGSHYVEVSWHYLHY